MRGRDLCRLHAVAMQRAAGSRRLLAQVELRLRGGDGTLIGGNGYALPFESLIGQIALSIESFIAAQIDARLSEDRFV